MAGFGASANGGALDIIFDGGVPRSFTGRARTVISGGQFVVVSGASNTVGSCISSYIPGSIVIDLIHDSNYANGIALYNVGSNEVLAVATRGQYIANVADAISGGHAVIPFSGTVQAVKAQSTSISYSGTTIGRAITAADSGTNHYAIVDFRF